MARRLTRHPKPPKRKLELSTAVDPCIMIAVPGADVIFALKSDVSLPKREVILDDEVMTQLD